MKERKTQTYIAPDVEAILIEVEQSILSSSTEDIGETLPDMDW